MASMGRRGRRARQSGVWLRRQVVRALLPRPRDRRIVIHMAGDDGVGYTFGWGDVVGAWRYTDYQMKSGSPVAEINFNGPAIAVAFRW